MKERYGNKKNYIKKDKLKEIFFLIAYGFMLLYQMVGKDNMQSLHIDFLYYLSISMFAMIILLNINNYSKKEWFYFLLLSLIGFIYYKDNFRIIKLVLILMAFKNINFDKCIKFDFKIRTIIIPLVIILSILNVINDYSYIIDGKIFHTYGFSNVNSLAFHIMILMLDIFYLYFNKLSIKKIACLLLLMLVVNYYSDNRTVIFIFIITVGLFYINKFDRSFFNRMIPKFLVKNSFIIISIIMLYLFYMYHCHNAIAIKIDDILSTRLFSFDYYYNSYGINTFGTLSELEKFHSLDNTTGNILLFMGYFGLLFYSTIIKKTFDKLYEMNNHKLIIIMLSLVIYSIVETSWITINNNIFLLMFSFLAYDNLKIQNDNILQETR